MSISTFDEKVPFNKAVNILPADGTNLKTLAAGSQNTAYRVDQIWCTNGDAIAHVVRVVVTTDGVNGSLGSVSVAAGAGQAGAAAIDVLAALIGAGVGIALKATDVVSVVVDVAVGAGNFVQFIGLGGQL